jgi:hypothetical protein
MEITFGGKDIRGKSKTEFRVHKCIKGKTRGKEATRTKRVSVEEEERGGKSEFAICKCACQGSAGVRNYLGERYSKEKGERRV